MLCNASAVIPSATHVAHVSAMDSLAATSCDALMDHMRDMTKAIVETVRQACRPHQRGPMRALPGGPSLDLPPPSRRVLIGDEVVSRGRRRYAHLRVGQVAKIAADMWTTLGAEAVAVLQTCQPVTTAMCALADRVLTLVKVRDGVTRSLYWAISESGRACATLTAMR